MTIKEKLGFEKEENFELDRAIDNYLNSKENKFSERDYFYASEIGQSKEELYKKFINKTPFNAEARVKRILDNGNAVHERLTKYLAEMGVLVASEIEVNTDLVHGRLDALISDGEKNYIVEIKSCSMWTFNKLNKPSDSHELQIQFYMYFMNIENGIVLYENKDNNAIKCFNIKLNKELVENYIKELEYLKECIKNKHIPEDKPITLEDIEYTK